MVNAAAITGFMSPLLALWLADRIPRSEDTPAEAERKTKELVMSSLAGVGIAYITTLIASRVSEQSEEVSRVSEQSVKGFTIA